MDSESTQDLPAEDRELLTGYARRRGWLPAQPPGQDWLADPALVARVRAALTHEMHALATAPVSPRLAPYQAELVLILVRWHALLETLAPPSDSA